VECASRQERDWLVAGFRLLLFGAEGRARARAFAYGRAMEQPQLGHTPQVKLRHFESIASGRFVMTTEAALYTHRTSFCSSFLPSPYTTSLEMSIFYFFFHGLNHHASNCHQQSIAAMSAASGAASSLATSASAEAAGTYAVQQLASTNEQGSLVWRKRRRVSLFNYMFSLLHT